MQPSDKEEGVQGDHVDTDDDHAVNDPAADNDDAVAAPDEGEGGAQCSEEAEDQINILDLPDLVLAQVLSNLTPAELLNTVPLVCRHFQAVSRTKAAWRCADLVLDEYHQSGAGLRHALLVLRQAPALRLLDLHMLPPHHIGEPWDEHPDLEELVDGLQMGVDHVTHLHMCRADALTLPPGNSPPKAWQIYLHLLRHFQEHVVWLRLMDCGPAGVLVRDKEAALLNVMAGMPRLGCLEYDYFGAGRGGPPRTLDFSRCPSLHRFRWVDGEVLVRPAVLSSPGEGPQAGYPALQQVQPHCRTRAEYRSGILGPAFPHHILRHLASQLSEFGFVPNPTEPELPSDVRELLVGNTQLRDVIVPVSDLDVIRRMHNLRSLKLVGDVGPRLWPGQARKLSHFIMTAPDPCFQTLTCLSLELNGTRVDSRCRYTRQFILDLCARCINMRFLFLRGSTWHWDLLEELFREVPKLEALYLCFVHFDLDKLERFGYILPRLKYLTINSWQFGPYEPYDPEELKKLERTDYNHIEVDLLHQMRPELSYQMIYNLQPSSVRAMHCGKTRIELNPHYP